ncbi:MAG: alpha-galactosidase, partial [Clostridia bacterium]|nr:alpha-galactosidase [Clostridia bacterium]
MDRLHAMEMKCILWYSVPFVGIYAKNFERFKNRYLRAYRSDGSVMVLDPRFADVREWLVETYVTALREWDLDGFKLDFIDSFSLAEDSSTDYDAMDCPSLEAAVEKLLDEIMTALKAVKPDVMIEFRQSYIGPVMQKYGNILRVGDCAGAALVNRVSSIDLRLLAGDPTLHETTAIHSDMLMWDYDASP